MKWKLLSATLALALCSMILLTACSPKATGFPSDSETSSSQSPLSANSSETASSQVSSDSAASGSSITSSSITGSSITSSSITSSSIAASQSPSVTATPTVTGKPSPTVTPAPAIKYFICGSWDGYQLNEPMDQMQLAAGSTKFYTFTVTLTNAQRKDYAGVEGPGHWYKITEGSWSLPSFGTDYYVQQPAPVEKTAGGVAIGLGSIWINQDLTLTILFDSVNQIVYDNANGKVLPPIT